jgi:2Fe-2S ferredoxin
MPKLKVLPHPQVCPQGDEFDARAGGTILDAMLERGIPMEHACEKACACSTCHVVVREGYDSLNDPSEAEEDMLDKAWGLEATSRLSCQARIGDADLTVEIPRYSVNYAREGQ